jgi:GntR family transcriptional regulator
MPVDRTGMAAGRKPRAATDTAGIRPGVGVTQYLQLASVLRHRITQGELAAGQQLPTVAQLADQYQLARVTVRQAYAVLGAEGLTTSQRGRGTFVATPPSGIGRRLRTAINDPSSSDIRFDILDEMSGVPLPATLVLGAATYPDYAFVRKIHVQDGEPFCLAEIHVASEIHARFPPGAARSHKIAWLLNTHAPERMHRVQQTTTVAPADLVLARQLGCSFATPVAHMVRRVFDTGNRLALAGRFWYRGDRFVADIEIPFDVWVNYPGVVIPDVRARLPDAA